jgi:uncharacterized protein YigA (DUF484 family)
MNADDVARFLKTNPEFFDQHPGLLEAIYVPHPHGGRAIPLSERQLVTLREKTKLLESKLFELIRFGEDNDAISEKVHRLSVALLCARDFPGVTNALYFHLREDFSVPHVALRVWGRHLPDGTPEGAPVTDAQRVLVESMGAPQCGIAADQAFGAWFGDAREHVRSHALIPLGATAAFGLLALGSEDAKRFYPEMGTLYLRRIGETVTAALTSRL